MKLRSSNLPPVGIVLTVVILAALPLVDRPAIIGGDEPHYALMTSSIAIDHDIALEQDYDRVENGWNGAGDRIAGKRLDRHLRSVNGRLVFLHPLGLPFIAAPVLALSRGIFPNSAPDIPLLLLTLGVSLAGLLAGWSLMRSFLGSSRDAALLVFCAYFGSPLWFYGRTFFTEPYTWAFAVFAVVFVRRRRVGLATLFLALVLAMKETGLLLVLGILAGSVGYLGARLTLYMCTGPAIFGLLFVLKNLYTVGTSLSTFQPYRIGDPVSGAFGTLFDPVHGVLWFAPLLFFSALGWLVPFRNRNIQAASAFIVVAYFLVSAAWIDWKGGSCYASRLVLPALPALVLPLANLWRTQAITRPLLFGLFIPGFALSWNAAMHPFSSFWGMAAPDLLVKDLPMLIPGIVIGTVCFSYLAGWFGWTKSGDAWGSERDEHQFRHSTTL